MRSGGDLKTFDETYSSYECDLAITHVGTIRVARRGCEGMGGRIIPAPASYHGGRGLERSPLMSGARKGKHNLSHKSDSFSPLIGYLGARRVSASTRASILGLFFPFPVESWAIKRFKATPNSPSNDWTGKP